MHGGFGIGPGQKNAAVDHGSDPTFIEDAKAEALNMSFGAGSYARRILEGMGWKEVSCHFINVFLFYRSLYLNDKLLYLQYRSNKLFFVLENKNHGMTTPPIIHVCLG